VFDIKGVKQRPSVERAIPLPHAGACNLKSEAKRKSKTEAAFMILRKWGNESACVDTASAAFSLLSNIRTPSFKKNLQTGNLRVDSEL
jgi:hypothetical protein